MNTTENISKFSIEEHLPKHIIYGIGAYLQTCAHIEVLCAAIVAFLRNGAPETADWLETYQKCRKAPTSRLIKELEACAALVSDQNSANWLNNTAEYLKQSVDSRHIAVHGAFSTTKAGFFVSGYVVNEGTKQCPDYQPLRSAITEQAIADHLMHAEQLMQSLLAFLHGREADLVQRIYSRAFPIVSHPEQESE